MVKIIWTGVFFDITNDVMKISAEHLTVMVKPDLNK